MALVGVVEGRLEAPLRQNTGHDQVEGPIIIMCYYDNYKFACNDWKWGNFRQHCQREYRTGETCGMKMVYQTLPLAEKCSMCEKIERKKRRMEKHRSDYQRWSSDPQKFKFSMEKAVDEMNGLANEIKQLMADKEARYKMIGNTRRN
ncbi:hypothetical protein D0861_06230 [Hortaea werneckii]|uniref:Uncharacterized protein n=1 Tax=Hortaea werneckii TaxID=91943 RepID=A0A3M7FB63_HORWE|nr:hypothetical protein D0861_06230 [Hortaea werneckii]